MTMGEQDNADTRDINVLLAISPAASSDFAAGVVSVQNVPLKPKVHSEA